MTYRTHFTSLRWIHLYFLCFKQLTGQLTQKSEVKMHTTSGETSLFSIMVVSSATLTIFDWISSNNFWACEESRTTATE